MNKERVTVRQSCEEPQQETTKLAIMVFNTNLVLLYMLLGD